MKKIKSLKLSARVAIVVAAMLVVGVAMYFVMANLMPPFTASATITVDAANIAEGTDLAAKPLSDVYKAHIKRVSAGRPDSGHTLKDMFVIVYGEEGLVCPHCDAALPADQDVSKKFTCPACAKEVDIAQPFKDAMLAIANSVKVQDETTLVFTATANDADEVVRLLNMFVTEVDAGIMAQAAKNYPDRTEPVANVVTEAERLPNTSPRTPIIAALAAILMGMIGYMVVTQTPANIAFRKLMAYTLLVVLSILCLFFFYILIINATRSHGEIQSGFSALPGYFFDDNWTSLMANSELPIWRGMFNSLVVSGCVAGLCTYFSVLTAYAIHAYQFKLRNFAFKFILLVMMVPGQVSALGFVEMMLEWGWTETFWPLIIPSIAAPAVFFFMKQYMDSALPLAIVEAARIDGSSEFGTFNRIVLYIMKPAIAVQAIFNFVSAWNNYFTPALLLTKKEMKTLPILIAQLRSADWLKFDMGQVYMMICLSIAPVIIVYLCLSKFIIAGVAVGGVKDM